MNEVIDKRKAISGRELFRLVLNLGIPGEKGGLVKRIRRRSENEGFVSMRSSYIPARKFGGENDGYGGERSRWRLDTSMELSSGIGNCKLNLLSG